MKYRCVQVQNSVCKDEKIVGYFRDGKGIVKNEFLVYLLPVECQSPSWPTQNWKITNLYVFWELLMLKQPFVVLEEQRVSGGVVMSE